MECKEVTQLLDNLDVEPLSGDEEINDDLLNAFTDFYEKLVLSGNTVNVSMYIRFPVLPLLRSIKGVMPSLRKYRYTASASCAASSSILVTLNSGIQRLILKNECRKESMSCREARSSKGKTGRSLSESDATYMYR